MSRIFLSHSSRDVREAIALKQWLVSQNPPLANEIFLDVDPGAGLQTGTRWKDALRQANARCEAVICLLSENWEASHECKVEYRTAENLNKQIFVARLEASTGDGLTSEWQRCDLFTDGAVTAIDIDGGPAVEFSTAGLYRLRDGIVGAGIGADSFVWPPPGDPDRAPYRGWAPLEEADAAVFFGRDAEILRALDVLRGMRRSEVNSVFVVLGPSGTGKSSFLRAGLLPRLRREDRRFAVCDIVRPERNALVGESGLAQAIVGTRRAFGMTVPSLGEVKAACLAADAERIAGWLGDVRDRAAEAQMQRGEAEEVASAPTLVLPLDQAEELFSADAGENADLFLRLLAAVTRRCNASEVGLLIAATIRTDRYEVMQTHPALAGMGSVLFDELKPMPTTQFKEVITGPADRASERPGRLTISPELVDRLLADAGEGADTLPMLALTLSRLHTDYGSTGELTVAQYETLGGMSRMVQTEIDEVLSSDPERRAGQLEALRAAFIPWLATVNPDNDQPMRRVARLADLPESSRGLIEALVSKRLMVKDIRDGQTVVEVALESLLRQWDELAGWLREERKNLKDADDLERAAAAWSVHGRDSAWLLSGTRLVEAETLSGTAGFRQRLSDAGDYLTESRAAENHRLAEIEEQRQAEIRNARERQATAEAHAVTLRRRSRVLRAVLGLTVVVAVIAAMGFLRANAANEQAQKRFQQATSVRLTSEAMAMMTGTRPGDDVQAMQQLLVARALSATPDDAALYGVVVKEQNTRKIIPVPAQILRVTYSPDGHRIATTGSDGYARIWDADSGQPVLDPLPGLTGRVTGVAFSPDGKRLATGGGDGALRIWDAESGIQLHDLVGHSGEVPGVVFSPDGSRLASTGQDKMLRAWDADSGTLIYQVPTGSQSPLSWVAYSPDSRILLTASYDGTVRMWNAADGNPLTDPIPAGIGEITAAGFSPDGKRFAVAGETILLWDTATGKPVGKPMDGHSNTVTSIAFSPNGRFLVSGSADATLVLWEVDQGLPVGTAITGHESAVYSVAFSPDGTRVVSGSRDKTVRIWDPTADQPLIGHTGEVRGIAYSPDGSRLASAGDDGTVRFWSAGTGGALDNPIVAGAALECLAFSPDGKRLAAGAAGRVLIWDVATRLPVLTIDTGSDALVRSLAYSPDGTTINVVDWAGTARRYDVASGAPKGQPLTGVRMMTINPDWTKAAVIVEGSWSIFMMALDGSDENWNVPMKGHTSSVRSLTYSPDGHLLASAADDATIRLWNPQTREPVGQPLTGHTDAIFDVAFSPDGTRLVSASADTSVRVWDVATGRQFGDPLYGHSGFVLSVAYRPDGKSFASGGRDGFVHLWPATATPEVVCDKLNANMSHKQWDEWVSPDIDYIKACPGLPVMPD